MLLSNLTHNSLLLMRVGRRVYQNNVEEVRHWGAVAAAHARQPAKPTENDVGKRLGTRSSTFRATVHARNSFTYYVLPLAHSDLACM